jgi:ribonuclease Y
MIVIALACAAAGAALARTFGRRRVEEARDAARAEIDALRTAKTELEVSLADARGALEAARAQAAAARTDADSARQAAEIATRDALLRAREEIRAEVEAEAKRRADALLQEARDKAATAMADAQRLQGELAAREERLAKRETLLAQKDELVAQREVELARREKTLNERERALGIREAEAAKLIDERTRALDEVRRHEREALERVAGLSAEEAKRKLMDEILDDAKAAAAREAKQIEDIAREEAEKRAKRLVGIALQRFAGDYAGERAVTSVHLPNDDLKGRIIGREGRNIRAFQEATGCDLVVDDTPETIVVSAFDPVKREVARLALEKLIADGRIHPTRIEECVAKARDEVERTIREAADQAVMELGLGRVHPEILRLVGMLRYRYSYAQNVLRHSVEVGYMAGLLAGEMGLNVKLARRAGFLHDIGKAVTHEVEGGHAVIGGQFARKHGEDEQVANAIASHHEDEPPRTLYAHLVMAADAISGARPGARREMLETYVKRLEDLERICASFKGVEKSFAIQAGREVRVFVEPGEVDDMGAMVLSRDIARRIENELAYPGQIRVTVVRETRAVDYAR